MKHKALRARDSGTSELDHFFQIRDASVWCRDNISSEGHLWRTYINSLIGNNTVFCFVQESDAVMFRLMFPAIPVDNNWYCTYNSV